MIIIYWKTGIWPFGEKTLLTIDLNNQYISFYSYLKGILSGNHSLFYSFSTTLGGNIAGLSAYYLMSPFNWLMLLFPTEQLPQAVLLITLLKTGFCGLTFYIFTSHWEWKIRGWIFAAGYALMSYNIAYQQNLMWMDGVLLLPLVILGIHWIFERKSPLLYILSLFGAILTNYYIGFMICIFSVLYFICLFISGAERTENLKVKIIRDYIFASLLAGGFSGWMLLPALKSLSGGKAVFNLSALTMEPDFYWSDFFVKLFAGSLDYEEIRHGLPNIYCGMTVLFFLGIYFLSKKISLRRKAGAILLLAVLAVSFYMNGINLIWHGFNIPTWFPYRYSFVFSFFMLLLGWQGMRTLEKNSIREILLAAIALALGAVFVTYWMYHKNFAFMSAEKYVFSILIFLISGCLAVLYVRGHRRLCLTGFLAAVCLELTFNGAALLSVFSYQDKEKYESFVSETEEAVASVKEQDNGFYRLEKTWWRKECDPMLLDYSGLSHYSSSEYTDVKTFMRQAGYYGTPNQQSYGKGNTAAMDSLLGVKYVLSRSELGAPWNLLKKQGDILIYQNPFALSGGFLCDENVRDFVPEGENPFEIQNSLWAQTDQTVGTDLLIAEPEPEITTKNFGSRQEGGVYLKQDVTKAASISYTFTAQADAPVYFYVQAEEAHRCALYVNGERKEDYFKWQYPGIVWLGDFNKGDKVKVTLALGKKYDNYIQIRNAYFYYQDMDVFDQYYQRASAGNLTLNKMSDRELTGSVSNEQGREWLMFSFPYDAGWKVSIDGKEAETAKGAGLLLMAQIPEGEHQIRLYYEVPGLKAGLLITVVSIMGITVWMVSGRRPGIRRKERN